jgi:mevalonate kinase
LLLGEYTVLDGGPALAVPLPALQGCWEDCIGSPDPRLLAWLEWLQAMQSKGNLSCTLDLEDFGRFVRNGGFFRADIPTGFGLGSSGALVAALLRRWGITYPTDTHQLRDVLAQLESFFHGSSSGLDPLVSLTGQAVLIRDHHRIALHPSPQRFPGLFIIDTGHARHTAPLVALYRELSKEPAFRRALPDYLMAVSIATTAIINEDLPTLAPVFQQISAFQHTWFSPMILPGLQETWTDNDYWLKLCGAGGGGFYLGMTSGHTLPLLNYPVRWVDSWAGGAA